MRFSRGSNPDPSLPVQAHRGLAHEPKHPMANRPAKMDPTHANRQSSHAVEGRLSSHGDRVIREPGCMPRYAFLTYGNGQAQA